MRVYCRLLIILLFNKCMCRVGRMYRKRKKKKKSVVRGEDTRVETQNKKKTTKNYYKNIVYCTKNQYRYIEKDKNGVTSEWVYFCVAVDRFKLE